MINEFTYLGRIIKVIEHDEVDKPKYRALVNNLFYFPADTAESAAEKATQYLDALTEREKSSRLSKPYTATSP